ncbi:hypothetical protein DL96DRAFT_1553241 [Flagelloscypha sp. PMI_526]|nr:hypothetical protein DL96DRAFT_1553241 [Flagelloscypha sp. PMI_526]
MSGILEMTIDELVSEFSALCVYVFSGAPNMRERTDRLKVSVQNIVQKYFKDRGEEERNMLSGYNACKVNMAFPRIFRNYCVRENQTPDCAIWEAACAAATTLGLFEPIQFGSDFIHETIVGGEPRLSNPLPTRLNGLLGVEQPTSEFGQTEEVAVLNRILSKATSHLQRHVTTQKIEPLLQILKS